MMKKKRQFIQLICALLYNCNFTGFAKGSIYQGDMKGVCIPGLNCYSCPGAIASCPMGSLQSALISAKYKFPYYILGVLLLFGVVLGRVVCGFLCPFGWFQELLYKIPSKKMKKNRVTEVLSYVKYVVSVVFAIGIPIFMHNPGFCKYICPAGTLEGGIFLVMMDERLKALTGELYIWKVSLLIVIICSAVFVYRSFCRFLCPLGAFYGLFSKISFCGVKVDEGKCNHCNACVRKCKMDVKKVGDRECIQCGECIDTCNQKAICFGRK